MKTKHLITAGLLLTSIAIVAQGKKPLSFDDCKPKDMTFVVAETSPVWKAESITFNGYIEDVLKKSEAMKRLTGKLMLGILIDENGQACLTSFLDDGAAGFVAEEFRQAVKQMPAWSPAMQNGRLVSFNKTVVLTIRKGKVQ